MVEWGNGEVQIVKSDTWYQIATNFVMSEVKNSEYPCWRYKAADELKKGRQSLELPELFGDGTSGINW